jgi:hypothetical protein
MHRVRGVGKKGFWCVVNGLDRPLSREELQERVRLRDRENFRKLYLLPALESGLVERTIPDKGLWTVETSRKREYIIRVASDQFEESSPFGNNLRTFDGRPLFFESGTALRPDPRHFEWHREKCFRRGVP